MPWDDARYLEVLARAKTPAAAARLLGVSASTVYRRIAVLEEELGAACVVRGSNPVALTEIGEEVVAVAREFSADMTRVESLARSSEEAVAGQVGLTTVEGFLPFLVDPLRRLHELHPELIVDVHLGDSGPSVWRREIEVAVGIMTHPSEGLIGRRLAPIHYGAFGTPEACERAPRSWVVFSATLGHLPEAKWEREHANPVALSTSSRNAMVDLVRAGVGVGALPVRLGELHGLQELPEYRESLAPLTRQAWLLTHPGVRNARVRVLSNVLIAALG